MHFAINYFDCHWAAPVHPSRICSIC